MNSTLISFAAGGAEISKQETSGALTVVAVGFLFVMVVLALLSTVTAVMGAYFARKAAQESAKAAAGALKVADRLAKVSRSEPLSTIPTAEPAAAATEGSPSSSDLDSEDPAIVAVIAAAVHCVIGDRPHRIVSIRPGGPGWAQEGRRQIFSSHRVR